jgi:uncharacterized protein involved in cysteine biosynthesis
MGEGIEVERLRNLRNFAILALVALAIALAPGGGTGLSLVLSLLTVAFFVSIVFLGYRLYMEHRFTLDSLSSQQRWVLYGAVGLAFWAFAATPRLFHLGAGGIAGWIAILAAASGGVYWVWRTSREYG